MTSFAFTATEAGVDDGEDVLVSGLASAEQDQYVLFQRDAESGGEDWGVHFEFNDQFNGSYECVRACSVARDRLSIELTEPIDQRKRISRIDIELEITDAEFEALVAMLRRIFRGKNSLVTIAAQQ